MIQTNLGGHSGCKVMLMEPVIGKTFVRKISGNLDYNERLKHQKSKQERFTCGNVKTPKILGDGYTDSGLYFFDMEYIYGITLAEYMNTLRVNEIHGLVNRILDHVIDMKEVKTKEPEQSQCIFTDKISDLNNKLHGYGDSIIDEAMELLSQHDWSNLPRTFCHGDLTLENIIVKENELYVIDFLDSFYDSWIMDISTLMQDVQALWSYRMQEKININTAIRLIIFRDILMDSVKQRTGEKYVEVYYALLLKLIRIYPYTSEKRTYQFLNEKTQSIINIIKNFEIIGDRHEDIDYSMC